MIMDYSCLYGCWRSGKRKKIRAQWHSKSEWEIFNLLRNGTKKWWLFLIYFQEHFCRIKWLVQFVLLVWSKAIAFWPGIRDSKKKMIIICAEFSLNNIFMLFVLWFIINSFCNNKYAMPLAWKELWFYVMHFISSFYYLIKKNDYI